MDTLVSYLNWNVVTAALAVVAVVIVALMVFRAFGGAVRGRQGARLGISEYHEIDKSRRLVLVRRDGVEHLLMIGGAQDLLIEGGIAIANTGERDEAYLHRPPASGPPLTVPPSRHAVEHENHGPVPLRPAPRPPVFGEKGPKLRPVARDEPRFAAPSREFGGEEKSNPPD